MTQKEWRTTFELLDVEFNACVTYTEEKLPSREGFPNETAVEIDDIEINYAEPETKHPTARNAEQFLDMVELAIKRKFYDAWRCRVTD